MTTAIHNLRNRIQASRNAAAYNDRGFVDVPIGDLERLLDIAEEAPASAVPEVSEAMVEAALNVPIGLHEQLGCYRMRSSVTPEQMRAALVAAFGVRS